MRWGLISVRIGILVVSVITTMLLILAVVPLVVGGLDIRFPQNQNSSWSYDNSTNVVSFEAPVQIFNGGFFDIEDFTVGIVLTDHNGTFISASDSAPVDLLAGRTNFVNVRMALDLNAIEPSVLRELAFNHTTLNMSLSLASYYMEHMVNIHIGTNSSMDWTPLIDNMQVDLQGMQMQDNGTAINVMVPYSFDAGDLIMGQTVNLRTTLRNSTDTFAVSSETVTITHHNAGSLQMSITKKTAQWLVMDPDNLTVDVVISFQGAEFKQTYTKQWTPLITDLRIGTPELNQGSPMTVAIPFGYNASGAVVRAQMQLSYIVTNSTAQITHGNDTSAILYHNSGMISMPFTLAQSSWFLRHSQDWTITLKATFMGITVEQTRPYHWSAPMGGP